MVHVPSVSPATGQPTPPYYIHTLGNHFVDVKGRVLLLRGVNLSGDTKAPVGAASHILDGFWDTAEKGKENFVGRPLRLEDADIHFSRLKGWGFTMLRYVVPWEALEHEGPGIYDEAFIDYTITMLRKCKEYGFRVYMDPHQDVWSRFSGGSGAPFWTLHACGLNPRNFTATGSLIHNEYHDPSKFPLMSWPTSYYRLPSLTMFTLFFGGRDFAPKCIIDGQNIQDYLQSHFIKAYVHLANRIREAGGLFDECVIGWESINEPSEGFIGLQNIHNNPSSQLLKKEASPTPAQAIRLAAGIPQDVEYWSFGQVGPWKSGTVKIDPQGKTAWLDPDSEPDGVSPWGWKRDPGWELGRCIWEQHGVWNKDTGEMLKPNYFGRSRVNPNKKVSFVEEYWLPHWKSWVSRIRVAHPETIHFIQPPLFTPPPKISANDILGRACYSPHFYDGLTLMTRHWNWFNSNTIAVLRNKLHVVQSFKFGDEAIRKNFEDQLAIFREDVQQNVGEYPVIIGETGTPYDMDSKKSYGKTDGGVYTGDHSSQTVALDASLNANDAFNIYNFTIWTYNADHSWEHGDGWNGEDLSIWSPDDYIYRRRKKVQQLAKAASESHLPIPGRPQVFDAPTPIGSDIDRSSSVNVGPLVLPQSLFSSTSNHLEFLTDGARALHAFCRPYPVKTNGRPKHISYSIAKREFSLTVRVEAGEYSGAPLGQDCATEIYIPLTTFSSPTTIFPAQHHPRSHSPAHEANQSTDSLHSLHSLNKECHEVGSVSSTTKLAKKKSFLRKKPSVVDGISQVHFAFASNRVRAASSLSLHLTSDVHVPLEIPLDVLDIDVEVSSGHWEVNGQTLKWWYDPPATPAEFTIKVRARRHPCDPPLPSSNDGCNLM
ncbi:hypothetical protein FRC02_006854 [Tulasnella sp. 418]|nr:hypothetical protein FRC02_006854 [Tulasnella sp. 418]